MDNGSETIGQRLREVRGREAMTQAEFAAKMQVSTTTVTRYEGGNTVPDGTFLLKLKEFFDVDPSWVLLGKTPEGSEPDETSLLADYKATSQDSKSAIRAITSIIANLEKGKG